MKQKIGSVNNGESDLDALFVAVYNLLYEKMEAEPDKGIVIKKGGRRCRWSELMDIAHCMEDYFTLRSEKCRGICGECVRWKSVSKDSPHLGECSLKPGKYSHKFGYCKKFVGKGGENA